MKNKRIVTGLVLGLLLATNAAFVKAKAETALNLLQPVSTGTGIQLITE